MNSKIILYKTNITPERNCRVDDLENYLTTCTKSIYENFQYKLIQLDDFIKLNMSQEQTPNFNYNYLSVKRQDDDKTYYYFILNTSWKSANTIELQISLDTINTFWNELSWTSKTNIMRQHRDRFQKKAITSGLNTLKKIIDNYDEGITPVKLTKTQEKINISKANYDWYLIYKSKTNNEAPIDCLCCAGEEITINETADYNGLTPGDLEPGLGSAVVFYSRDNTDFVYTASDGKTYTIGANQTYKGLSVVIQNKTNFTYVFGISDKKAENKQLDFQRTSTIMKGLRATGYYFPNTASHKIDNFGYLKTYDYALSYYDKYSDIAQRIVLGETTNLEATLKSVSSINRTDTTIVKIIKLPYAPFELKFTSGNLNVPNGWSLASDGYLRLVDLNSEFLTSIYSGTLYDLSRTINKESQLDVDIENDIIYESKLYNSNFYQLKYYYDNFSKEFFYERYTPNASITNNARLEIKFKQSNNISSNSLFDFDIKYDNYQEPTLYSKYLNANRQNEVALYTSEYLNYIRTGFNYDKKAKTQQAVTGWLSTGLSLAGTAASFIASPATGGASIAAGISLATSTIASIASTINNSISAEQNIQQKLETLQKQASGVSNTEDLNLLSYYNGNRLIRTTEECTEQTKNMIYELFRLTGYACNDYAIPDFTSRSYYNFVQCKPVFDESNWNYGQNFLNDIKSRFQVGITVYHKFRDKYNWNQNLENFEKWLVTSD